jgi:futalosine hydrolase
MDDHSQPAEHAKLDGEPQPRAVAVVAAVAREIGPLRERLDDRRELEIGRRPATRGRLDGNEVVLLACGMGKTNAAQALTALLEQHPIRGIANIGVGGAYAGSGLDVGGLALATSESYGDEGVDTPAGWISTEGIGIPLLDTAGILHFNVFPLDAATVAEAADMLAERGFRPGIGPFVTVSCCSGTAVRGRAVAGRFGAICESMEGAALAHVARLYDVPFLELRGISNHVEDRDLSRWRFDPAIAAACEAAAVLVELLGSRGTGTDDA